MVTSQVLDICPLVISAPFGNYVQPVGTTPTLGTFTALRRGGRKAAFGRALLTVRYYRRLGAWVNKIGLRNPGIDSLTANPKRSAPLDQCLLSIHGFNGQEWNHLLNRVRELKPLAVELNISCPNVGELTWPPNLFADAIATGVPVIVKVPPVRYEKMAQEAFAQGVRWFHATNTLPVPRGGMSGAPLKPLALGVVSWLRTEFGHEVRIVGGGGIRSAADVAEYAQAGANRFAIGTYLFTPKALANAAALVAEIQTAAAQLATD